VCERKLFHLKCSVLCCIRELFTVVRAFLVGELGKICWLSHFTSAKENSYVLLGSSICLFVCLLTTSRNNYWLHLHAYFTRDVSSD